MHLLLAFSIFHSFLLKLHFLLLRSYLGIWLILIFLLYDIRKNMFRIYNKFFYVKRLKELWISQNGNVDFLLG